MNRIICVLFGHIPAYRYDANGAETSNCCRCGDVLKSDAYAKLQQRCDALADWLSEIQEERDQLKEERQRQTAELYRLRQLVGTKEGA